MGTIVVLGSPEGNANSVTFQQQLDKVNAIINEMNARFLSTEARNSLILGGQTIANTATIWTNANDGASSGLDADLLDGNNSTAFAFLTGATFTGDVLINKAAGNNREFTFQTSGVNRWGLRTNSSAEAGSDAGSDYRLIRYADGGGANTVYTINRATGAMTYVSSTFTVGGSQVWTSGNDGTGSGLDADLLDGLDSAAFAQLGGAVAFSGNMTATGYKVRSGTSGSYSSNYFNINWTGTLPQLYMDTTNIGTIWCSGNDGTGSGLDADLLDGQDGTYYAPAGSPTFTGTITLNAAMQSQTLTDGATINWNMDSGKIATVTIAATGRTMANPTNLKVGTAILVVAQDATGSRTITTWGSVFKWPGGVAPTLSTGANQKDIFSFFCDGSSLHGSYLPNSS